MPVWKSPSREISLYPSLYKLQATAWVRDRNGYGVQRHGYMNVDVAATGGSRSSSTVNVHGGARNMNVEPGPKGHPQKLPFT